MKLSKLIKIGDNVNISIDAIDNVVKKTFQNIKERATTGQIIYYVAASAGSVVCPTLVFPFFLGSKIGWDIIPKNESTQLKLGSALVTTVLSLGIMALSVDAYLAGKLKPIRVETNNYAVFEKHAFDINKKQLSPFFVKRHFTGAYVVKTEDGTCSFGPDCLESYSKGRLVVNSPNSVKLSESMLDEAYSKQDYLTNFEILRLENNVARNAQNILIEYLVDLRINSLDE